MGLYLAGGIGWGFGVMKFPIGFGWWFSAVLNKYPYASCLNPHIGVYRPQRGGLLFRFPPTWRVWSLNIHPRDRAAARNKRITTRPDIRKVFQVGRSERALVSVFQLGSGAYRVYWRLPFSDKTKVAERCVQSTSN